MNIETKKSEIINWIIQLKDFSIVQEILKVKEKKSQSSNATKRTFGCGKGIFTYVSEDFDEPLDDFKDYMPS